MRSLGVCLLLSAVGSHACRDEARCESIALGTDVSDLPTRSPAYAEYYDGEIGLARHMACCAETRCVDQTTCACDCNATACEAGCGGCESIDCTSAEVRNTALLAVDEPYSGWCKEDDPHNGNGEGGLSCFVRAREGKVVAVSWYCRD